MDIQLEVVRLKEQYMTTLNLLSRLQEQYDSLSKIQIDLARMVERLDRVQALKRNHETRLSGIEGQPGKRWEMILAAIIAAIISFLMHIILNR